MKASRGTKLCSYFYFYSLCNILRIPALQNKQVVVLRMAFRARKFLGTFEIPALGGRTILDININIKANVSRYDSWERHYSSALLVTHNARREKLYHSWKYHTEDRGGRGRLQRRIKKEEEEISIRFIVFQRRRRPRSVESLKWTRSLLYNWLRDMLIVLIVCFSRSHIDE